MLSSFLSSGLFLRKEIKVLSINDPKLEVYVELALKMGQLLVLTDCVFPLPDFVCQLACPSSKSIDQRSKKFFLGNKEMDVHPHFKLLLLARQLPEVFVYKHGKSESRKTDFYQIFDQKGNFISEHQSTKRQEEKIVVDIHEMSWIPFDNQLSRLRFALDRFHVINFSISQEKLSKEITSMLVHLENPDLQIKSITLAAQEKDAKNRLFSLETNLIKILSKQNSDLLNDPELLKILRKNKKESFRIEKFLEDARELSRKMTFNQNEMKPLASKICGLFKIVQGVNKVRPSYGQSIKELKSSLKSFISDILAVRSIRHLKSSKAKNKQSVSDEYFGHLYQILEKPNGESKSLDRSLLENSWEHVMVEMIPANDLEMDHLDFKPIEIPKKTKQREISFRNNMPSFKEFKTSVNRNKEISFMNFSTNRNNDSFSTYNNFSSMPNQVSKLKASEEKQENIKRAEEESNLDCSEIHNLSESSFDENLEPDPLSRKKNVFKEKIQTLMTRKTLETDENKSLRTYIQSEESDCINIKKIQTFATKGDERRTKEVTQTGASNVRFVLRKQFFKIFQKKVFSDTLSVVQTQDKVLVLAYLLFGLKLQIEGGILSLK